jgi:EAL domain-containing protein (putative c-di-GMP-specific phosphodiesterase class I)
LTVFLADVKEQHLRKGDTVGDMLINGNTFVILLSAARDQSVPRELDLQRIRDRIAKPIHEFLANRVPAPFRDQILCYMGCAVVERDLNQRPERMIYQALDDALRTSLHTAVVGRPDRLSNLRQVLMERAVRPVYQPLVDLQRARVIGYEALSRVPFHLFTDIEQLFHTAQESNFVWQLERLCREKALKGLGRFPEGVSLFLNVEPISMSDPQFRSPEALQLIRDAGLAPDRVVLEVTEHSGVQDFQAFRETLEYFRGQGFRLAIDDVGTAYSGLRSIAELHPDFIKIDMSLTRDVHENGIKRDLIQTINRFSEKAGISLIAEGVETPDELRTLRSIGVRLAQGYLFARPDSPIPEACLDAIARDSR